MRLLAPASLILAASLLSGCLSDSPLGHVELDCSEDSQITVGASREMLVPASTPDQARLVGGPARATVTAREGQTLYAQVTYSMVSGEVNVLFDAPHENQATTDRTWNSQGEVSAGDYTLELEGAPFAFEVTYTMVLIATGCTPA